MDMDKNLEGGITINRDTGAMNKRRLVVDKTTVNRDSGALGKKLVGQKITRDRGAAWQRFSRKTALLPVNVVWVVKPSLLRPPRAKPLAQEVHTGGGKKGRMLHDLFTLF